MVDGFLWKKGWRTVGPGGGGAQFYPAISPHDDKHMMVFCDMQGTYMTRDGGKNWRNMSLRAGGASACFDPGKPGVVYAGSTALYRSDDGGETWRVILPDPKDITGESWHGDEAMHAFAASGGWVPSGIQDIALADGGQIAIARGYRTNFASERVDGSMNVLYSQDGGGSWASTAPLPKGLLFRRMVFENGAPYPCVTAVTDQAVYRVDGRDMSFTEIPLPEGETRIEAACGGLDPQTGQTVTYLVTMDHAANQKRLFRLVGGGAWKHLDYGVPSTRGGFVNGKCVACCPTDASVLYLSVFRAASGGNNPDEKTGVGVYEGLRKSTDFGETWEWSIAIDDGFPPHVTQGWMEKHYGYEWPEPPCCVTVAPGNPDVCVYTTYGTSMRTDDGGKHWYPIYSDPQPDGSAMGRGLEVTTCYGVHFNPFDKENLMISYTDIGLFRSVNQGRSWFHAIQGIPHAWRNTCYDICYDPGIPGKVWGGWGNPHDIPRAKLTYKDGFRRMTQRGYPKGGVSLSTDGGQSWTVSNHGMSQHAVTTSLCLDPDSSPGGRTLYAACWGTGVYRSDDGGGTWALKNNGLEGEHPFAWKILRRSDGALLLLLARGELDGADVHGRILISTDRAENWQALPMPADTVFPNDLAFDPRDPGTFYVTMWPRDVEGRAAHGGIYKTADGGQTWLRLPLPGHVQYTYGVTVDAGNPDTVYAVDFQQNCHRSDDGGATWRRLGGYSVKWGHKAFPDPHNPGMLYITTFGSSVFYGPAEGNGRPYDDVLPLND